MELKGGYVESDLYGNNSDMPKRGTEINTITVGSQEKKKEGKRIINAVKMMKTGNAQEQMV